MNGGTLIQYPALLFRPADPLSGIQKPAAFHFMPLSDPKSIQMVPSAW